MKFKANYLLFASAIFFVSCSDSLEQIIEEPVNEAIYPPVESNPANTNYPPAFAGQTRANGVKTTTPFTSAIITSSLNSPWGITALPDGRLLVTQKGGTMRIVTNTGSVGNPITGIPSVNSNGQGGLLGVCIDPQFSSNRMVYWVFSENVAGGTVTSVAKGMLSTSETSIQNPTVIYRANPSSSAGNLHYGGRILFDPTGNLMISVGERSDLSTRPLAQSVTAAIGKIIRITKDGNPAPGNPAFSQSGALPELYSIGHRNPQGIALHPVTGELWQGEHGPRGGDEINRVLPGKNYGWPTITYGVEYSGAVIGSGIQQQSGMEQPVYYWDPVISPSGMTFYRGNNIPEWQNNLFVGALSGQHIVRLVIKDNRVVGEERLLENEGQRFRDIVQGTDNALYAITDGGRLYKIQRQ
ncbi:MULTISPECIES: PQQ-dependent sugar dehydrogenase [Chryseobacterium]|uniref:Soluble aldose sugar dehydrogenase yliI n=1 Tax=Chryseobacterium taihuense TaxID=1141221 RepID=A0A4U8WMB8_9FLAO|nr:MULTISPECIES: PQQ-dependent sugar dehydrogenase [Chryseobacterium]QQV03254.1 PQQ-dependent sugar dehydrogenase [Chryseobacterium sp. FDAARGOS 1104]VFB03439.1 Soluble aldose sugar dehydrogenase yliI precursor [Chryseobacterium taihuense]